MNKGVTILELIVVIVIIGILAGLAIPNMGASIERSRLRAAEFNLLSIYNAQKRYKLDNESQEYYHVQGAADKIRAINENLSLSIDEPYFDYDIEKRADGYKAIATRINGTCRGATVYLTEENDTLHREGCSSWPDN